MKFLRLPDSAVTPLFEDEEILVFDKPYGIDAHTNDSKAEHAEFIRDGLIEILEKVLERKLHIVHRLDQTTSGAIVFGKSVEAAKKYAEFFFNRQVKKTYWFVTAARSQRDSFEIATPIIHKGRELEANTEFRLLQRASGFECWEAKPHTGRNHQIRIHAQAGGVSILGDSLYGGASYERLCLHNHRIEFPNGIAVTSRAPVFFSDLELLKNPGLVRRLSEIDRRWRIYSRESQAPLRMMQTETAVLDQYGEEWVLNGDDDLSRVIGRPILVRSKTPSERTWVVSEGALKYECRDGAGQAVGLPLSQRLQRAWVTANSRGKSVLNVFAHNCGFALAAAVGGATDVVSVDSNAKNLNWGRRNFELSGVEAGTFLCRDSLVFLAQALKKQTKFDLVVCDVPSFYRGENGVFKIEKELDSLLKSCLQCLKPGGQLLFSTADEKFFVDDLRETITKVLKSLGLPPKIEFIQSALDLELPEEKPRLKSFLIHV